MRFSFVLPLSLLLIASSADAAKGKKAKKGKAPAAASTDKKKGGKESAKAGPRDIVKKDIKKEGSLDPKSDFKGPVGSEAASAFDKKAIVSAPLGPGLKVDARRAKLETAVSKKRDEQIKLLQNILQVGTAESEKPQLFFRLGELYWEKSKEWFFKSEEAGTLQEKTAAVEEQRNYQAQAMDLYKSIVTDYPQYERVDEVLYYLGVSLIELGKSEEASSYYTRLIKEFSQSQYVPDAWLAVGEYFFDKAELPKALKAYQKAEEYSESSVYGFAVYKQGWCYINLGQWDQAMDRFRRVIKYFDEQQKAGKQTRLSMRKEAQKDYVRAYSNVGTGKEAKKDFIAVAGKENYRAMLETLGNIYVDQGKQKDVIALFKDLITDQPTSTRNAVYQGRVVEAASRLGNKKYTVTETRQLTKIFLSIKKQAETTKDAAKKDEIEKDLRNAQDTSENTVRRLATSWHQEAIKTKNEDLYGLAMELYGDYLQLFPDTVYAYDLRFFYAELLYKLEEYEKAAEQYSMVVEMRPDPAATEPEKKPRFLLQAAEEAVRAYDNVVTAMDKKAPVKVSGVQAVEIPDIKGKLIAACEKYLHYVPNGPRVVEIRYKMARIYYTYNHFEEAAPAFTEIVRKHPKHETAVYAANLTLDIYNGLKDYDTLAALATEFYEIKDLGDAEFKRGVRRIIEATTFKKIEAKEKSKDYIAAAEQYMSFIKQFPESEYVEQSVYNAAVNYDKGGKLDAAIATRRMLIEKFPKSPLVPTVLYNIAESYERVSDFERAAAEYEVFAQRYAADKRAEDALYNAGVYRRTLLQYNKANDDFNAYLKAYPSATEASKIAFIQCEMLEEQRNWSKAEACFFDYFKRNKAKDPERWLMSQYKRGLIYRDKTKYKRGADEALGFFEKEFTRDLKKSKDTLQKMPLATEAMAALALISAEQEFAEYKRMNFKNPENVKAFKKSFEDKGAKAKAVKKTFEGVIVQYKVAEQTLASLYYMAEVVRDIIRAFNEVPLPKGLNEEQKQLYREELKAQTLPFEEQAIEAYKACVKKANDLGVYNRWSVKALERLHDYRPDEFPLIAELRERPKTSLSLSRSGLSTELPKPVTADPKDAPLKTVPTQKGAKAAIEPKAADGKSAANGDAEPVDAKPATAEGKPAPVAAKSAPEAKDAAAVAKAPEQPAAETQKEETSKDEEPKD